MATTDEQWWDAQAGEYVLGTLRGVERDVFEKILAADEDTREKVRYWQQHFASLDAEITQVEPPEYILSAIMAKLGDKADAADRRVAPRGESGEIPDTEFPGVDSVREQDKLSESQVLQMQNRVSLKAIRIWKGVACLSMAATIALAVLLVQTTKRQVTPMGGPLDVVSVVQNEQVESLWILTTRTGSSVLQAVALAPPPINDNQSYQLWMVRPDNAGVSSVGLLPKNSGEVQALSMQIPTSEAHVFAVSLEPAGGSPEPVPTGPVLFIGAITPVNSS